MMNDDIDQPSGSHEMAASSSSVTKRSKLHHDGSSNIEDDNTATSTSNNISAQEKLTTGDTYLPELQHRPSDEEQFIPLALHHHHRAETTGNMKQENTNVGPADTATKIPESNESNNNAFAKRVTLQRAVSSSLPSPDINTSVSFSQMQSTLISVWPAADHCALVNRSIMASLREAAEVQDYKSNQNEFLLKHNSFIQVGRILLCYIMLF
jgi:hypothetical protein